MPTSSKATEISSSTISEAKGIAAPVHEGDVTTAANECNPSPPRAQVENDTSPRKSPEESSSSPGPPGRTETFAKYVKNEYSNESTESEGDEETVSSAHNRLARAAMEMEEKSQQELIKILEARIPKDWRYVQTLGEIKSTIMHVLSDRWNERLSTFFQALMEQFPEMYLAEDYLNHTILDRNQSGRSRDLFARFFTKNYQVETAELIKRHPNLLVLLLSALEDSNIWTRILREIPSDALLVNGNRSGNTFLHSVIQEAHRVPERASRRFLTLIEEITQANPKTMRAINAAGLTPYLYNTFEAKWGEFDLDLLELDSNNLSLSLASRPLDMVISRLKLRPYLRYVLIPQRSPETLQIKKVFECLYQSGVTRIRRLVVDEDITYPHNDDDIVKEIKRFQVEELDWRKTDMCSTVLQRAAPNLRAVHLYSSGNNAVLRGWSAEDGLIALEKLEKISVLVLPLIENMETVRSYITQFNDRVTSQLAERRDRSAEIHVVFMQPQTGRDLTTWSKTMAQPTVAVMSTQKATEEWSASLRILELLGLPWGEGDEERGLKVALVDDGVDILALKRGSVAAGVSFASRGPDTEHLQPYYAASSGRGTQLASIISSFHPGTRLCIARVESNEQDLAKALRWSIRQKVQIIVLGTPMNNYKKLNIGQDSATNELDSVLRELETHGIPVLCPFDDSDNHLARIKDQTVRHIGATRWDERMLSPATFPADFNILVEGLELANGVSADAAATAFAAGLATLVMGACRQSEGSWAHAPELWRIFDSFPHAERDSRFISVLWLLGKVEAAKKEGNRRRLFETISEHLGFPNHRYHHL
ncbi:hypothetical protein GQX73_g6566 [Xylaria multiplex]|uniref:Peptidase S8/S53 domain-containing protein n=1 Tax=Xylaria multiplex TaxID=323545 RepID=A0A7C8MP28_9PEZI|nr:hypothetical protein GQX73_g6566 [Xylaria multiplex]